MGDAVDAVGHGNADRLVDRRCDVDDVMELRADAAHSDLVGPMDDQPRLRPAEVASDLLGPLEQTVDRPCPSVAISSLLARKPRSAWLLPTTSTGRFDPLAMTSGNDRYLRIVLKNRSADASG
jgi:hypothetical protein